MKRVLPILVCLWACTWNYSDAQVLYTQDFESGWPADYTLINVDMLTPDDPDLVGLADSAWSIRYITQAGVNSNAAFSVSWYLNDAGPSDDWMILPAIDLGDNTVLSWDGMAITSSGNFRDRYQVAVSTGGPEIEDFEENPLLFDTGTMGEEITPQSRSVNLAEEGYANQTVYIAFRNFTAPYDPNLPTGPGNGGNELMIDNILVENITSSVETVSADVFRMELAPNPAASQTYLSFELPASGRVAVQLTDLLGRAVRTLDLGHLAAGKQAFKLDLSMLEHGVYWVQLRTETTSAVLKLVVSQ